MKKWKLKTVSVLVLCISLGIASAAYGETRKADDCEIEGIWVSDQQEGPGRIYYPDGHVFEGFWSNGKLEGTGISYYPDGSRGIWTYYNDMANGLGLWIEKGGKVDAGIWEDQKRKEGVSLAYWKDSDGVQYYAKNKNDINDGKAIAIYSDGAIYLGEFHNGKREGWGTYYYPSGNWYMGQWKNGMFNGAGYLSYFRDRDVLYYMGTWADNNKQGGGIQYDKDGDTLIANHKDGLVDGPGVLIKANGNVIFCEYKNGQLSDESPEIYTDSDGCRFIGGTDGKSGSGLRVMKSGSVYIGDFKDMKPEGYGFAFWPESRNTFDGQWKDGKQAKGTVIFHKGNVYTGTFWGDEKNKMKTGEYRSFRVFETGTGRSEDGELDTGTRITFYKDGSTVTTTVKNGVEQN